MPSSTLRNLVNANIAAEREDVVARHNAYGWIKPDAEACCQCGRKEYATPVDGFIVRPCLKCERSLGECCADIDYGGGDDGSRLTSWNCQGEAREQCQQIADGILWIEKGLATGRNDSCQRCSKKYGEPSPECPNWREHASSTTALAPIKLCMECRKPTMGSIGQAGYFWTRLCQPCKDEADGYLRTKIYTEAVFMKVMGAAFGQKEIA